MTPVAVCGRASRGAVFLALIALGGCAALHPAEPPAPAQPPPPAPVETAPPAEPPPAEKTTADATADSPPAAASAATPACACMESKPKPKSKPRAKPRPVHKEAPPQLATAKAVTETPPGGVINAVVKPMSVSVMSILGKKVKGAQGEDLGRVVDVLADASGRVRIAIIDFGGFLGVGNHRIAVDWPLLRFNPDGNDPSLLLSLSPEKLKTAPEYKDNPRPQTLMEPEAPMPAVVTDAAAAPAETKK
jgi:hypothetical protein